MSRTAVASAIAALIALFVANVWLAPDPLRMSSPTSFGTGPRGYGALYDLLTELGVPVERSYERFSRLGVERPVWLVWPDFLEAEAPGRDESLEALERWVRRGGTVVIFGRPGSRWPFGLEEAGNAAAYDGRVEGDLVPVPRRLEPPEIGTFERAPEAARVLLRAGDRPSAVMIARGDGSVVAVADGRFLTNQRLDEADANVLAVDFVRAFGPPRLDERSHGFRTGSLLGTLAGSRASLALWLLAAAAALWVAAERRWPPRGLVAPEEPDPSLREFVGSLGVLYSRRQEPAAAFDVYREGVLRGFRRAASVTRPRPAERLLEALRADPALDSETRRFVVEGERPRTERELVRAVAALERLRGMPR